MTGNVAEWVWDRGYCGGYWQVNGGSSLSNHFYGSGSIPFDKLPYVGIRLVSNQKTEKPRRYSGGVYDMHTLLIYVNRPHPIKTGWRVLSRLL